MKQDDQTLDTVIESMGPMLTRIAANHEANPSLREDLLQEIVLAVWKALPRFRGDASLRTFVARVANNRAVDHLIHQARNREREHFDDSHHHIESSSPPLHNKLDLATAMQQLPLPLRQVMGLMLEGFQQREIAQVLGINENAVAQRQTRARKALRARLNPECKHDGR